MVDAEFEQMVGVEIYPVQDSMLEKVFLAARYALTLTTTTLLFITISLWFLHFFVFEASINSQVARAPTKFVCSRQQSCF